MRLFANLISIVFHPLWIPLFSFMLFTWGSLDLVQSYEAKKVIYFLLLINIVLPAASIFYLIRSGALSGIELKNRKERSSPYMLVIIYYLIFYYVLTNLSAVMSSVLYCMFLGIVVSIVLSMLINLKWKISVHMLAIGGLFGSIIALTLLRPELVHPSWLFISIISAGFVGFARVYLNCHNHAQVYSGFLLGAVIQVAFILGNVYFLFD